MDPRMLAIGGQIIGGYLMGQQQREQQQEQMKLKQQEQKMLMDAAKLKSQREERELKIKEQEAQAQATRAANAAPFVNAIYSKHGITPSAPANAGGGGLQFGNSFGPESSQASQPQQPQILDILSKLDPMEAYILKEHTGLDWPGMVKLHRELETEKRNQQEFDYRRQRDQTIWGREDFYKGQETHPGVTVTSPTGSESVIYPPKYNLGARPPALGAGPAAGGGPPGIPTKPGADNMPILSGEFDNWVKIDPKTGSLVRPDFSKQLTRRQLAEQGFKYSTKDQQDAIGAFAGVENTLSVLEGLMEEIFPKDESAVGRVTGAAGRAVGAATQLNQKATEYEKFLSGTLAPMIRALGEKGALANEDVARALNMFPKLTDSGKVAWAAIDNVKKLITGAKRGKAGPLLPDTKHLVLPPQAAKQLKEGTLTKFGNGQVWTLKNGVPTRVE